MTAGDQVWGIFNAEIERGAQSKQGHWVATVDQAIEVLGDLMMHKYLSGSA